MSYIQTLVFHDLIRDNKTLRLLLIICFFFFLLTLALLVSVLFLNIQIIKSDLAFIQNFK